MPGGAKDTVDCAVCKRPLPEKDFYIVRIEGFYTPELPDFTAEDLDSITRRDIENLIERIETAGAEEFMELEEEVYKRYTFRLCRECYKSYIIQPLPQPEDLYE